MENVNVITQMMAKTRKNFSFTVNYLLEDWVKVRTYLANKQDINDRLTKEEEKPFKDIKKAKVIKQ